MKDTGGHNGRIAIHKVQEVFARAKFCKLRKYRERESNPFL